MRKLLYLIAIMLMAAACGGRGGVERAIRDALVSGDTTQARFDSIVALIKSDSRHAGNLLDDNGNINVDAMQELVDDIGSQLRPPASWNIRAYGQAALSLSIYFERSGSMIPYDSKSGGGQLKKTVNDLINFFPGGNTAINIVNDNIYPYNGTVESFLQDRDIYASTKGVGDASFTDFSLIFNKILSAQKANEVSVLISDMIYSPTDTRDLSVDKIFNEENSLATSLFKKFNSKSVIIYKLQGDYNGPYYPYNQASVDYHGSRPYYVLVIADATVINRMMADSSFSRFLAPAGAQASYRFNQGSGNLDYRFVLGHKDDAGRYRPSRDDRFSLTHCEGDRTTGKLVFTIAANLGGLGKSDDFLSNADNYNISSQSGFELKVRHITDADINNRNRDALEGMTHLLTFTGKWNSGADDITVTLRNDFPQWIAQSSTDDDTNTATSAFATTTFGLEQFLRGIAAAYPKADYASLVIHLHR